MNVSIFAALSRRGVALVAAALLVSGCAGTATVPGEVTRFHRWENADPRTIAFRTDPRHAGSLEYASYETYLRERLAALGFSSAPLADARYQVSIAFSATPQPRRVVDVWAPGPYGPVPGWGGWRPGLHPVYPPYFPYSRYDPWWGFPAAPIVTDLIVWRHEVRVDLWDMRIGPAGGTKVFEATAAAVARSEALPRLVPALVDALLSGFPGANGVTYQVEVPLPARQP